MGQVLERQPARKQGPLGRIRVQLKSEVKELSGGETHLQEILLMVDRVFRKAWCVVQEREAVGYMDAKGNAWRLQGRTGVGPL